MVSGYADEHSMRLAYRPASSPMSIIETSFYAIVMSSNIDINIITVGNDRQEYAKQVGLTILADV